VVEVRRAMAHGDFVRHADTRQSVGLERGGVDCAGRIE
jgi:hypothetical protein